MALQPERELHSGLAGTHYGNLPHHDAFVDAPAANG